MKHFLAFVLLLISLVVPALAQVQGPALRSTNGVAFSRFIINDHLEATNTARTNIIAGRVQGQGSVATGAGGWVPGLNSKAGQYSLVTGIGNDSSAAGAFVAGSSNIVASGASYSIVGGSFNQLQSSQNQFVSGYGNVVGGQNSAAIGRGHNFDGTADDSIALGQNVSFSTFQATNNFAWSDHTGLAVTRSNSFNVQATGGSYFTGGPIYGNGSGLSNVSGSAVGYSTDNVKFWGALGDNSANDLPAIQACADFATNHSGLVFFPEGIFRMNGTLNLQGRTGITLRGSSHNKSVLLGLSNGVPIIDALDATKLTFEDLEINIGAALPSCALLIGRSTDANNGGEHTSKNLRVLGSYTLAGVYSISSELNGWDNCVFTCNVNSTNALFYSAASATNIIGLPITSPFSSITTTGLSGNGFNTFDRCQWLSYSTNSSPPLLVSEYGQATALNSGYFFSSTASNQIVLGKTAMGLTLSDCRQEFIGTQPVGIYLGTASVFRDIHITGSSLFALVGTNGSTINGLTMESSYWVGTNSISQIVFDIDTLNDSWINVSDANVPAGRFVIDGIYKVRTRSSQSQFVNVPTNRLQVVSWGTSMLFDGINSLRPIGAGTTNPLTVLHSVSADGAYPFGLSGDTKGIRVLAGAASMSIQGVDNTLSGSYQPLTLGGSILIFQNAGIVEAMRITNSNVAIGLTDPSSLLHIKGSSPIFTIHDNRNASFSVGDVIAGIDVKSADASGGLADAVRVKIAAIAEDTFGTATGVAVSTHNGSSLSEKVRITNDGKVGIGTTSPNRLLSVNGSGIVSNTFSVLNNVSTTPVNVGGVLKTITTSVGNVGAGTDTLITYTIPASQMGATGEYLEFDVHGTCAANANPKQITVTYGGTTLIDGGAVVLNGVSWKAHGKIVRTGAATQEANCELTVGGTLLSAVNGTICLTTSPTETLSGTVVFACTGTSTVAPADNDIVQKAMFLRWFPAGN